LNAGDKWIEHDLVFSNSFGRLLVPTTVIAWFHALMCDVGLPRIRFHDLRHSAATILLTKGMHPKVVQELLGHSSIAMTMDIYSHVMPSMQQDATNKMDDEFKEL